jgi:hypothetical protein
MPGQMKIVSPGDAAFTAAWMLLNAGAPALQLVAVPWPSSSTTNVA